MTISAGLFAAKQVDRVRDDPQGRLILLSSLYEGSRGGAEVRLPYRRAALAFMRWQLSRGLLDPSSGSPWWRAVNERLLRDTCESRALTQGMCGTASSASVRASLDFIHRPSAATWYRAHNLTIVLAYLEHRPLAEKETQAERFFLNLVLVRMLYAHALVAAPKLALGWLSLVASIVGDPRLGMTGIFLSLARVLPDRYPLREDIARYVGHEHGFGRLLDLGVIQPRLRMLYDWSARELVVPELANLLIDGVPAYAWDPADAEPWHPPVRGLAAVARRLVPAARP